MKKLFGVSLLTLLFLTPMLAIALGNFVEARSDDRRERRWHVSFGVSVWYGTAYPSWYWVPAPVVYYRPAYAVYYYPYSSYYYWSYPYDYYHSAYHSAYYYYPYSNYPYSYYYWDP